MGFAMTRKTRMPMPTIPSNDPWAGIGAPAYSDISTRLISESSSHEVTVCWALTSSGHKALLISYPFRYPDVAMPKLKSVDVKVGHEGRSKKHILIELLLPEVSQQFRQLCQDVISVVSLSTPKVLCRNVKLCLDKWRYLLSPKTLMSSEAQKGLLAELLFLERVALKLYSTEDAIYSWTGPMRSPRDFSFGTSYVEVKSNRGSKHPVIRVSSESQLSTSGSEQLFLYVVSLDEAPEGGISLDEKVTELRQAIEKNLTAKIEFDMRVAAAGFRDEDAGNFKHWRESKSTLYEVKEDFPRIQTDDLRLGVDSVTYDVDLTYCVEYQSDLRRVQEAIGTKG